MSGQAWGEENLLRRPAILDMPVGRGQVISFNFNPFDRDMNRGGHHLVWNAIFKLASNSFSPRTVPRFQVERIESIESVIYLSPKSYHH